MASSVVSPNSLQRANSSSACCFPRSNCDIFERRSIEMPSFFRRRQFFETWSSMWVSRKSAFSAVRARKQYRMAFQETNSSDSEDLIEFCDSPNPVDEMTQSHPNPLKELLTKKYLKLSAMKTRKLREALKRLHDDTGGGRLGCRENTSYFGVPLQHTPQITSSLTNSPVPYILESITSYLLRHVSQEGILRKCGNERRANALKDLIENNHGAIPQGTDFSAHDITCVLKRWLKALPEPVIPEILHEVFMKCVDLESHHNRTHGLLLACLLLPTFHLNTLKHVAVFLQEISKQESKNKMSSANLAKVLAPTLMPFEMKAETNTDHAKKFNDLTTTAVEVLIDHAHLISQVSPELARKDYKTHSEDEYSDQSESNVKRKLFTFLKPRNVAHKGVSRSSSILRNSRKHGGAILAKRPISSNADSSTSDETEPTRQDVRVTRSTSKRRQLSAETVKSIRDRRALKAIQNTRNQPIARSLPLLTGSKRRSVRRAATCRSEKQSSSPSRRVLRSDNVPNDVDVENQSKQISVKKSLQNITETVTIVAAEAATIHRLTTPPLKEAETISSTDRTDSARKSFLAGMIGSTTTLQTNNKSNGASSDKTQTTSSSPPPSPEGLENFYKKSSTSLNTNSGNDPIFGEPGCLDRHGVFRKPLILSNKRAIRRETPVNRLSATITVQL